MAPLNDSGLNRVTAIMDGRAHDYRRKAKEAEASAQEAEDVKVRQPFLDIAQQWRDLADQVQRNYFL